MGEVVELHRPPPAPDLPPSARDGLDAALDGAGTPADLAYVDLLLAWLRFYGFKIVPVD